MDLCRENLKIGAIISINSLLNLIHFDTSTFQREGNTLGDSAVGEFINPNDNIKYIIKKSKKEAPLRAANQQNNQSEIINDILTEYFISLIGEKFTSIQTCRYLLAKFNGMLRIASVNFLADNQSIFHGRELFESFYNLEQLEDPRNKKFPTIYLLFNIEKHLKMWLKQIPGREHLFQEIFDSFLRMCFWDAIIGNNDRHLQNWGIITSLDKNFIPCFSPIFDTARAFKWNSLDNKLQLKSIEKYSLNSCPHIGIRLSKKINHFELIKKILIFYPHITLSFQHMLNEADQINICTILKNDDILNNYFSHERKEFISNCYQFRINKLKNIMEQTSKSNPLLNKIELGLEVLLFWGSNKLNRAMAYFASDRH